jgi:hypothetical protein
MGNNNIAHTFYVRMKKCCKIKKAEFRILRRISVCKILDRIKDQDMDKILKSYWTHRRIQDYRKIWLINPGRRTERMKSLHFKETGMIQANEDHSCGPNKLKTNAWKVEGEILLRPIPVWKSSLTRSLSLFLCILLEVACLLFSEFQ